jgi:hypothetical protein
MPSIYAKKVVGKMTGQKPHFFSTLQNQYENLTGKWNFFIISGGTKK